MAAISLIDPYSQQAEEIARRKRMAQALQESGSQVLDMPTTPGVTISPYAGLAKILESGFGAYQEAKAQKDYAALQDKYRTNYNKQFGDLARAISAPAQEAFAGQEAIQAQPAQMAPKIPQGFGGYGMPQEVGQYETAPAVEGQAAIPARPAIPAGYISPETLKGFDIPEVQQLAMAKYLKQFEPEQLTLGENQRLLRRVGGGDFKEVVGVSKTPTAATPSDLARLLAERAAIAAKNPTDSSLAKYDSAIEKLTQDKNLAFQREKFEYETANPGYSYERVKNPDGSETIQAINKSTGVARPVRTGTGQVLTSAAPSKKVRMEVTAADGSTKIVLMDESDPKFAEGFATKGPDYVSITTVNAQGETEIRQVKKDDSILTKGYVKPLEGFLGQLQAAGVPMDKIRSDPKIRDLVDRYFVNAAGGVSPENVFGSELRKAEVVARLGELGIAIPASIKGLNLSVTPGPLGGTQPASAAAPAPASAALPLPADKDKKKLVNGQTYQTNNGLAKWNAALGQFVPVP